MRGPAARGPVLIRQALTDLFLTSAARHPLKALLLSVPVAAAVMLLYGDLYSGAVEPTGTAHPVQSINVAVNRVFCGRSMESSRHSLQVFLTTRPDLWSRPYRDAIAAQAGSLDEYCTHIVEPVVVSENSLMWLARVALVRNPDLTPDGLGRFLGAVRVGILLFVGFALLMTGASLLFTLASVLVASGILRAVALRDTIYPFVLVLPLLLASLFGIARASAVIRTRRPALWSFVCAIGAVAAFSASMRTMNLPLSAAMLALFLAALYLDRPQGAARGTTVAVAAAAFVIGFVAYNQVFVASLQRADDANVPNYTYHTFAHQLVLGLAVPENDLSRREGIQWNDETGFALAKRVEPDVTYLGPRYESALVEYYRRLWAAYPRDMAAVYWGKLRATGDEVFLSAARVGEQFRLPRAPAEWLHRWTNGLVLFALAGGALALAFRQHLLHGSGLTLTIALISLAALVSLVEAFLIYSVFVGMYYSILLFFVFFLVLVALQSALDLAARAAGLAPRV